MPSSVVCPNCRSTPRPDELSDDQSCPVCGEILPAECFESTKSNHQASDSGATSSALDMPESARPRPTGSITLLRQGLRSDEKDQQGGWMEGLFARRVKANGERESSPDRREQAEVATAWKRQPGSSRPAPESREAPAARVPDFEDHPASHPHPHSHPRVAAPRPRVERPAGQVPILGVLTFLVVGAIASVAVLQGQATWANVLFLATVSLLGVSILGILHRKGDDRAFWQGFALFGWGYLIIAFVPWTPHPSGLELPTSRWLGALHGAVDRSSAGPGDQSQAMPPAETVEGADVAARGPVVPVPAIPQSPSMFVPADLRQFTLVGHCLLTLLAALLGSSVARWFSRSNLAMT
ncbi:hypothetical protein P12x_002340 [Tundrisphaera lichenicola]|uniref:hypothetical protein n=1 Tax=Tundrisphaera lichenicola TaxID=2029860 RepID=UPI003EB9FFBE